jgi:hypothetical protein
MNPNIWELLGSSLMPHASFQLQLMETDQIPILLIVYENAREVLHA